MKLPQTLFQSLAICRQRSLDTDFYLSKSQQFFLPCEPTKIFNWPLEVTLVFSVYPAS